MEKVHVYLVLLLEKSYMHMHADMVTGELGVRAEMYNPPNIHRAAAYAIQVTTRYIS